MRPVVITVFDSEAGTTADHNFVSSPVRIGRNPLNDLPLPFPFVSGWHAVVRFDDGQAKFFDLGSTNGTLLNGRKIQAGEAVVIGEMLSVTIGKLELRFGRGDAVSSLHPAGYGVPPPAPSPMPAASPPPPHPVYHQGSSAMPAAVDPSASRPIPVEPSASRPIPVEAPAGTAHVQMGDVHHAIQRLRPAYDAYRNAWAHVEHELQASLGGMHPSLHEFAISVLAREFTGLSKEPGFGDLARRMGARVPGGSSASSGSTTAEGMAAVARLAQGVRPEEEPPRSTEEAERFLACVEDVLRASAKAFVELQKGQEQFGRELGVRTIKEFTPLHAAGTPENVLKYLLDWQKGGPHRTQELVGVYADLGIHQIALLNGVMEGVRSLLAQLDPAQIERSVASAWGSRGASAWKAFVQRYRELTEADRNITEHVFGPEFARAYAEVGGEGSH